MVDAPSLIFQVFHAIPEMTSPKGQPVNAVFGFTRDVLYLLDERKPDYLFCAFDAAGPTFRHELFDQYKAHRAETPGELVPQFEIIDRMLAALSVPVLELPGYEADDILATIARQTEEAGGECILVTGDKDCRQLISDQVKVLNVRKNVLLDAPALADDWGIRPDQVADFQALVGDSVDNIPGVPLIGPKIAGELLQRFGTLEGIYEHLNEISGQKRKENLAAGREQALKSRELARLDRNVPLAIDWHAAHVPDLDRTAALPLFVELGFHGFANKLRTERARQVQPVAAGVDYRRVESPEALEALVRELLALPRMALKTVTTHPWPRWAQIVGLALAGREHQAHYVPLAGPGQQGIELSHAARVLAPLFQSETVERVAHDLKYETIVWRGSGDDGSGLALSGPRFDLMVASYLIEAGERDHSLQGLAKRHFHDNAPDFRLLMAQDPAQPIKTLPPGQLTHIACQAADVSLRLRPVLAQQLEKTGTTKLYESLELPLIDVLADMEFAGIKIDVDRLAEQGKQFAAQMAELEKEIYALAGREFNIASPKQLQEVLFAELKLPSGRRTKSGRSTDADVLEALARVHPLPAKILDYRQLAKLKGTYIDALPAMVHPRTGRVHASFNQTVAATGRLSAADPNLQNLPVRTEVGREIRAAIRPGEPGWKLLSADYSQIELRVLAHLSGDEALRAAFERDEDIHARVASEVFSVPLDGVTSEMRRRAKAVNFGVVYGQSPFGLAQQLGIEQDEAAQFIEEYFRRYQGVEDYLLLVLEECHRRGYVTTIEGRRRNIDGVRPTLQRSAARRQLNLPERTAINTVIQGSAADLIKLAMISIHRRLLSGGAPGRMLLQVHDELVFEVPEPGLQSLAHVVVHEMSTVMPLSVPLKVDASAGDNWAEMESL
ncbi:MAG: DNA polymerase I [Planctomycetia bacterium]|nr:DNA polymerase I [Planctomycetia bacterium]